MVLIVLGQLPSCQGIKAPRCALQGYAAEGAGDGLAAAAQESLEAAFAGSSAEPDAAMLQLNTQLKKRMFLAEDIATRKRVRAVPAGGGAAE